MKPRQDQGLLVLIGLLAAALFASPLAAQEPIQCSNGPLSEEEVIKLAADGVTEKRMTEYVDTCGVSSALTPEREKRLRAAKVSNAVIAAIAKKAAENKKEAALKSDAPPPPNEAVKGAPSPGSVTGGIPGGAEGNSSSTAGKTIPKRIRVGSNVMVAKLVKQPRPIYPHKPGHKRISGTVRLQVIVATDGAVDQIAIVSGDPELAKAAVDAVRQWRYQPTLLNGNPVEVETIVEVVFTISR